MGEGHPTGNGPTEIPEQVFRGSDAFRHLAAVKSEQRRLRQKQLWADLRTRWPLRRVLAWAGMWLGPWLALGLIYWLGGGFGRAGSN